MTCPFCHATIDSKNKFCNICGNPIPVPVKKPEKTPDPVSVNVPKPTKKRPWALIIVAAVVCLALLAGNIFSLLALGEVKAAQEADWARMMSMELRLQQLEQALDMTNQMEAPAEQERPAETEKPEARPEPPKEVPAEPEETPVELPTIHPDEFYIGIILSGSVNSGISRAQIAGLYHTCDLLGVKQDNVIYYENVTDPQTNDNICRELAASGVQLIITTETEEQIRMEQLAEEFPDSDFVVLGGFTAATAGLPNLSNAWPKTSEIWYVAGIMAGMELRQGLERGVAAAPHATFVMEDESAASVSDCSAFYLGMRSVVEESILFAVPSYGDPEHAAAACEEVMYGTESYLLVEHRPEQDSGIASIADRVQETGYACQYFGGTIDGVENSYSSAMGWVDIHWELVFTHLVSLSMTENQPLPADWAPGINEGAFDICVTDGIYTGALEGLDMGYAQIYSGTPVFDTGLFSCSRSRDGSATVDSNGRVTALYVHDTDGDGVEDSGNAVENGMILEGWLRSAPAFDLHIEGIEVVG